METRTEYEKMILKAYNQRTIIERRSYAFDVQEANNKRIGKSSRRKDAETLQSHSSDNIRIHIQG